MQAVAAIALVVAAYTAPPLTWDALAPSLPKDAAHRAQVLTRFAKDDDVALADRRRAVQELLASVKDARRVEIDLIDAHLAALARRSRRPALLRALADAKRFHVEERVGQLVTVIKAEDALAQLSRKLPARFTPPSTTTAPPPDPLVTQITNALPMWLAVGDEREHGVARVALARKRAATDLDGAIRDLDDAVDSLGTRRDTAAVRADAWRWLSRFQDALRPEEAAAAALAADRADAVDVTKTNAPATPVKKAKADDGDGDGDGGVAYLRSRETSALCGRARERGVSCAKLEQKRWGDRTFYDFSQERSGGFDERRADDVLHEYESLLQDCLARGAKANLTSNTHVELVWSVGNDGRVKPAFDLAPQRLRGTVVDTCLAGAFAAFRYPRYRGEMQHVRLSFDVGE